MVTTDDFYLNLDSSMNPLLDFKTVILCGAKAVTMEKLVSRARGEANVIVVHAMRSLGMDIEHKASHVIFT